MITDANLQKAINNALGRLREGYVPRRPNAVLKHPENPVTGNLKYNALKVEKIKDGEYRVFIDVPIAPYMPYTNEPWVSPKWNGAKNPNEYWWQEFCKQMMQELAIELSDSTKTLKRE